MDESASIRAFLPFLKGFLTIRPAAAFLVFAVVSTHTSAQPSHLVWGRLLKKHVNERGEVHYRNFAADRAALNKYLDELSANPPVSTWTKKQQLAFWINAYNAFTIKLIIDHYPTESIKDLNPTVSLPQVNTIWHEKFFSIGGQPMSLDHIEHAILRQEFSDPRIHFAINCASVSCPILLNEAYTAERIEQQLQTQAVHFINDPSRNKIRADHAKLSQVFNWFRKDFVRNGTLIEFINQYSKIKIDKKATIGYLDYDWSLNDVPDR
jgi:hypothetical protein